MSFDVRILRPEDAHILSHRVFRGCLRLQHELQLQRRFRSPAGYSDIIRLIVVSVTEICDEDRCWRHIYGLLLYILPICDQRIGDPMY